MHRNEDVPPWSWFGDIPPKWQRVCILLLVFGVFVNLGSYTVIYLIIGGCAANGKIENGKYYVCDRGASYVEVSECTYFYSKFHRIYGEILALVCLFSGIAINVYFKRKRVERK